uniref:Uncharacterized protein n=1 Tax=Anguilla anguilla TaxID=7936 RepID=A0A0E9PNE0_ANGAN
MQSVRIPTDSPTFMAHHFKPAPCCSMTTRPLSTVSATSSSTANNVQTASRAATEENHLPVHGNQVQSVFFWHSGQLVSTEQPPEKNEQHTQPEQVKSPFFRGTPRN